MIVWFAALTWSRATLVLGLLVLAIALLWYAFASLINAATTDQRRRSYPIVDYSDAYRRKVEFLGSRFLLAKPINRRVAR